jgi:hypothetical protein
MKPKFRVLPELLLAALFLGSAAAPAIAEDWPERYVNPKPTQGDVMIPLPCGGSMVFRKVTTGRMGPGDALGPLEDKQVSLGSENPDGRAYLDFRRTDYISGSFADKDGERYFLIGKYEVTQAQFDAVMTGAAGGCQPPSKSGASLPKGNVSWFEAVEFTREMTTWLYKNHPEVLPRGSGGPGYVRLPNETEWEFSARGGLSVSDSERSADFFPTNAEPPDNFAWFSTPEAGSEPQPVGAKGANPLGLHDVLGNVEEIVLEPFRMNRVGRLHGQIGGFIARGGSIQTEELQLTLALREEYPFFSIDEQGETRRSTLGFRVAVGGAATGDYAQATKLEQAFEAARNQSAAPQEAQPAQRLDEIARSAQNKQMQQQLAEINAQLQVASARRNELEARAAKNLLLNAVLLFNELTATARAARIYDQEARIETDPVRKAEFKETADEHIAQFKTFGQVYTDLIKQLGEDLAPRLDSATGNLRAEFRARRQEDKFGPLLDQVIAHVDGHQTGRQRSARAILQTIAGPGRWVQ